MRDCAPPELLNTTASLRYAMANVVSRAIACSNSAAARTMSAASLARTPCEYLRSASSELVVTCSSGRSEEHTSELQSQSNLVCRLLLEKKKTRPHTPTHDPKPHPWPPPPSRPRPGEGSARDRSPLGRVATSQPARRLPTTGTPCPYASP